MFASIARLQTLSYLCGLSGGTFSIEWPRSVVGARFFLFPLEISPCRTYVAIITSHNHQPNDSQRINYIWMRSGRDSIPITGWYWLSVKCRIT